jgi:AbrB family looped-hinge helix DNA binding protein
MSDTVEVGKHGRITLPKELRQRHSIRENTRLIVRERGNQIILIPVKHYENPTDALYGSVKFTHPVDDPKAVARAHVRKQSLEE